MGGFVAKTDVLLSLLTGAANLMMLKVKHF